MKARFAIIIPSYQPQEQLAAVVEELHQKGLLEEGHRLIVVDDGSTKEVERFEALTTLYPDTLTLLRHLENRGKGAALKTALAHILTDDSFTHMVCVDADGQHAIADVERVMHAAVDKEGHLILGARAFTGTVPLRSRFGNAVTEYAFLLATGRRVSDTQTGLRAFDREYAHRIKELPHDRYEYELRALMLATESGVPIAEVAIATTYIEGNQSSHFRPLVDSARIYQVLLRHGVFIRFGLSAFLSWLVDYTLFLLLYWGGVGVLGANVLARIGTVPLNFVLNEKLVFRFRGNGWIAFGQYLLLAAANPFVSAGLILLIERIGVPVVLGKILVETSLFFINYLVQRIIFKPRATMNA